MILLIPTYPCRYIEVFRSTHAEIRPVATRDNRWSRNTPYTRPSHQWCGEGDYGGYANKYGSGYERGYRGRGGRGGGMPANPAYGGYGGYGSYPGGYDFNAAQPGFEQYNHAYGAVTAGYPSGAGSSASQMVSYPPIRPTQGGARPGEGGGDKSRHVIKMRGLPYSSEEKDILNFFLPHVPASVNIDFDNYGRPSGEAEVTFNTHQEAQNAMEKHNAHMGTCVCVCVCSSAHSNVHVCIFLMRIFFTYIHVYIYILYFHFHVSSLCSVNKKRSRKYYNIFPLI